jgi:hypothetical protein
MWLCEHDTLDVPSGAFKLCLKRLRLDSFADALCVDHSRIGKSVSTGRYEGHKLRGRRSYDIRGTGGIDVGGAVESLTGLKSFADMVRAKGSLGLIGEECASVGITVTTQPRRA